MTLSKKSAAIAAALLIALVLAVKAVAGEEPYELELAMPSADGTIRGTTVWIAGQPAGEVTDVSVKDGAARIKLKIDEAYAPLHSGTMARISWNSVLGRRMVELEPGEKSNPQLPSGKVIESDIERVELDTLVASLDAPTRRKVKALVAELDSVVTRNDDALHKTIVDAGPLLAAVGRVTKSVGEDGDAINGIIARLRNVTSTLSSRDARTDDTVRQLHVLTAAIADQETQLAAALDELPSTLDQAQRFFDQVPGTVEVVEPLLTDLQPAIGKLPSVARKLSPVMGDLRPTVADLRPTLRSASSLLQQTPTLLDLGTSAIPTVEGTLDELEPAVSFLRPYTPEIVGFLTNWASLFSGKNRAGHFGRAMVPVSATMLNLNPGIVPPGITQWEEPLPGQLADQPWTDANGDAVR